MLCSPPILNRPCVGLITVISILSLFLDKMSTFYNSHFFQTKCEGIGWPGSSRLHRSSILPSFKAGSLGKISGEPGRSESFFYHVREHLSENSRSITTKVVLATESWSCRLYPPLNKESMMFQINLACIPQRTPSSPTWASTRSESMSRM